MSLVDSCELSPCVGLGSKRAMDWAARGRWTGLQEGDGLGCKRAMDWAARGRWTGLQEGDGLGHEH